jgi:hypothetical protein
MAFAEPALGVPALLFPQRIYKHVLLLRGHGARPREPFWLVDYDVIMAILVLPI